MQTVNTPSKAMLWTGRIITIICVLFLVMDGGMKLFKAKVSVDGSVQLGWPETGVQAIGIVLLICTLLYAVPRTAVLGAILLTGYLGGATAIMVRAGVPVYFPIIFGVLVWAGVFLNNEKLRGLLPFVQKQ